MGTRGELLPRVGQPKIQNPCLLQEEVSTEEEVVNWIQVAPAAGDR